uniref:Sushi domain-containing protein n=1 Tax=Salvator merianae TaxID=96440 RepID=A0A8D0C855_SALMN
MHLLPVLDATCKETPRVDNADLVEDMAGPYLPGQQLNFQCHEGFDISGPPVVTCEKGKWSELPKCEDATCPPPPRISNGEVRGSLKEKYLPLEKVHYRCFQRYSLVGPYAIMCVKKQWTELPLCEGILSLP